MEDKELHLLEILEFKDNISQREIALKSGLSLGVVNTVIKSCVKKGFIKVETLNYRSIRYILTPKGINEKTKKSLAYIKSSYKRIIKVVERVKELSSRDLGENKKILIFGENDEIFEIVSKTLKSDKVEFERFKPIFKYRDISEKVIYVWDIENEERLKKNGFNYENILK